LPPCWAITKILIDEVHLKVNSFAISFHPQGKDFEYILLFSGALLFLIFYSRYKFEFLYTFLHEFTHLIFGIIFLKKIVRFKVARLKGEVVLSGTNFIILLAPYFFPLLTFILLSVGFLLWEFLKYKLIWYLTISLVGFSLMLHIVMTLKSLMVEQSDIKSNGYFFSFVTIYFLSVSLISGIIIFLVQGYMEALAFFSILLREVKNIFLLIPNLLFD